MPTDDDLVSEDTWIDSHWITKLSTISQATTDVPAVKDFAETASWNKHTRHRVDFAMGEKRIPVSRRIALIQTASLVGARSLQALSDGELQALLKLVAVEPYW